MSKFKNLIIDIMEMYGRGNNVAEIATALQCGRSVVEYVIDTYAAELSD
jgi:orotate phosphoribosyltransferase-like protein